MLLEHDGWLAADLAPDPGGVEARLFKKFGNIYANQWNGTAGVWNRGEDDTVDTELEYDNQRPINVANKGAWAARWAQVTQALVDHHQFGGIN